MNADEWARIVAEDEALDTEAAAKTRAAIEAMTPEARAQAHAFAAEFFDGLQRRRMGMTWIHVTERLPEKAGTYPVFIPTADPKRPMRHVAWFEPEGTPNMSGWQVNPLSASITHWCEWPEDPGE